MSKKRLLVNTSSNMFVTFLKMAIAFIMTPILVTNLGNYDYGIWEIIVAVIGYMGLLDVGMRPSVTRNIAYNTAKKDIIAVNEVFSTSLGFMLVLSALSASAFFGWAYWNPDVLAETDGDIQRYQYLLIIIAMQLGFFFPGAVAESTLEGFHKYYLKNNVVIVNTVIGNFLIWYLIKPENAILIVAGVSALGVSIKYLIFFVFIAKSKEFPMVPRLKFFSLSRLKELIVFGAKSFVQGVVWRIQMTMDPLLIAWILGPAVIIFYAIPANLINYARTIAMTMTQAFLPIFSELAIETDKSKQNKKYLIVSKLVITLLTPIFIGIFMTGPEFISLWIGPEYGSNGKEILYILTVVALIAYIDPFANKFLTAENKHGIYAKIMPFALTINFISTVFLLKSFGVIGAALGTLIPAILLSPVYWTYRSKVQGLSLSRYVNYVLVPLIIPSILMISAMSAFISMIPINSFMVLISVAICGVVAYLLAYFVFSLTANERRVVTKALKERKLS